MRQQWANMGALVRPGLHRGDFAVIARALAGRRSPRTAPRRRSRRGPRDQRGGRRSRPARLRAASPSGSGRRLFALCNGADSAADGARVAATTAGQVRGGGGRHARRPTCRRSRRERRARRALVTWSIMWGSAPDPGSIGSLAWVVFGPAPDLSARRKPRARGSPPPDRPGRGRFIQHMGSRLTRGTAPPVSRRTARSSRGSRATAACLAVPEAIERMAACVSIERLATRTLTEVAYRALRPLHARELDATDVRSGRRRGAELSDPARRGRARTSTRSELFHGPTLAFKDVGARTMARLMASLDTRRSAADRAGGDLRRHRQRRRPRLSRRPAHARRRPLSGRTRQPHAGSAVDDVQRGERQRARLRRCRQLRRLSSPDARSVRRRVDCASGVRLTSANSVNIGRLLPQMVYYFHAVAQVARTAQARAARRHRLHAERQLRQPDRRADGQACRPADRASSSRATNVNDVVPEYLDDGLRSRRAPSVQTIANAMDVGNPSNFERMLWLYQRRSSTRCGTTSAAVRTPTTTCGTRFKSVYETRGYLLDPALARLDTWGWQSRRGCAGQRRAGEGRQVSSSRRPIRRSSREIVEPIIGRRIDYPRRWRKRWRGRGTCCGWMPRSKRLPRRFVAEDTPGASVPLPCRRPDSHSPDTAFFRRPDAARARARDYVRDCI